MDVPRRSGAAVVVGLCAAALLWLAVAFYLSAARHVFANAERAALLAVAGVVAVPWLLIAAALAKRRRGAGLLMAMTTSIAYLLCIGWLTVLVFVLSWERRGPEVAALAATGVHVVALIAAIVGWRGLPAGERSFGARGAIALAPIAVGCALAALAFVLVNASVSSLGARAANESKMERQFRQFAACLEQETRQKRSAPRDPTKLSGDCTVVGAAMESQDRYRIHYLLTDDPGRYILCLQPDSVPDDGLMTFVSDETGYVALVSANDRMREPHPCSRTGSGPARLAKTLQYCMLKFREKRGAAGYPRTLDEIRTALPGCLDERQPGDRNYARTLHSEESGGSDHWLNYSPKPGGGGQVPGYRLYLRCRGTEMSGVIDESGVLQNVGTPRARAWLNGCTEADTVDVRALARAAGLHVPSALSNQDSGARFTRDDHPRLQGFSGKPQLDRHREQCAREAASCIVLGHELERSISLSGGGSALLPESLNEEKRAWLREARAAYIRACEAGEPRGCDSAGLLAEEDLDRDARQVEAFDRKGCDGGMASACARLGSMYAGGMKSTRAGTRKLDIQGMPVRILADAKPDPTRPGVDQDIDLAVAFHERACDLGETNSCGMAGVVLLEKSKGEAARSRANEIFARHCRDGYYASCSWLTRNAREDGTAAGRDAAQWQSLACLYGGSDYCE